MNQHSICFIFSNPFIKRNVNRQPHNGIENNWYEMLKFVSTKLRVPHQKKLTFPLTFEMVNIETQSEPLQRVTELVQVLKRQMPRGH